MTNHQKAFKEAEKELQKDKILEIKNVMKSLLQEIQKQKEKKSDAEESLRLLKLDMDDLRTGKIEKIRERHDKSEKAREVSTIKESQLNDLLFVASNNLIYANTNNLSQITSAVTPSNASVTIPMNWQDATSGTYLVNCASGTTKEFNL